jgi:hypothetical protein
MQVPSTRGYCHDYHLVHSRPRWVVYAKPPFAGPQAVLAYLACYTHRVNIQNRHLNAFDASGPTFCSRVSL